MNQIIRVALRPLTLAILATALLVTVAACSGGDAASGDTFPIQVTDERVETGSKLYASNCAACHGTPNISQPTIPTAPPHDENGHTWHHPDRLLFEWVLDGPPLAETMPAFRGKFSDEEVLSIIAYLKSTWPSDIQQFQREGSEQYEQQLGETS